MKTFGQQGPSRSFGAGAAAVALLALSPPVQALSSSSGSSRSCVQITDVALSSSCVSGTKAASFAFTVAGTRGVTVASAETGVSSVEGTTPIAARGGEASDAANCPATGARITVGFAAPVALVAQPGISSPSSDENMATLYVETLESNPTEFKVVLDTTDVARGTNLVTYVAYSDDQGNAPDVSGLMTFLASSAIECDGPTAIDTAADISRRLHPGHEEYDCDVCANLSDAELEALAMYDNGGKQIICDPTCLDGVTDPIHCNYFGLGQICRGCGDCSSCTPCPVTPAPTEAPISTPAPVMASTSSPAVASTPTPTSTVTSADDSDDDDSDDDDSDDDDSGDDDSIEFDCGPCADLSDDEVEALAKYDNGGKTIVCDPTCLDGVSDPIHCNYFGLGQICRGCGDCSTCTPCP